MQMRSQIWQFIKFCIVGVTNTIISYVIYVIVLFVIKRWQLHFDYIIANIVSYILSVLWSFYWNSRFVFEDDNKSKLKKLLKTYASYCFTGVFLNGVCSYVLIEYLKINKMLAPLMILVITVPCNYLLNRYWTFRSRTMKTH